MKKIYSTPTIEVERFDVIDVITTSATDTVQIRQNGVTGTGVAEVEIITQW